MDMAAAFIIFAGSMIYAIVYEFPLGLAMLAGLFAFLVTGLHRGFRLRALLAMSFSGMKGSLIVVRVMLAIGILTGLWRSSGTFAILTSLGLRVITPSMFILSAFILSCILSYALGTSFGTAGTLGITLMTLARSGGVSTVITAGAIMSGIHFGDRGSPASSCAHLVASLTGTEIYHNVKAMMKTAVIPMMISLSAYALLSMANPLQALSTSALDELASAFTLSPAVIVPAVLMLVLPLLKVNIFIAFLASIAAAFASSVWVQGYSLGEAVSCAVWGFSSSEGIKSLFNGGGLISMVNICLVLMISGTYEGIFGGTKMLDGLQARISGLISKFGAYPVTLLAGILADGIFCNQTVGVMMTSQLMKQPYASHGLTHDELALDLADAPVITAPLIPFCIACSVPLGMMEVGIDTLPYACYLYLVPLCHMLTKKYLPHSKREA